MAKQRPAGDVNRNASAFRTVTVTIQASHALILAKDAERRRVQFIRDCQPDTAEALREGVDFNARLWGDTAQALAEAYRNSLCER